MAAFGEDDVARLMADAGIVRNRAKIEAAIANARAALDVPLAELIWSFAPDPRPPRPRTRGEGQATTPESKALAKALKKARLPLRRPDDGVRADAGLRARRRPLRGLPCSSGLSDGGDGLGRGGARRGRARRRARGDERPYTFFNFVATLDGRAALDGSTRPLGGPADLEMLLSLRAVADAVLIGPGTVRAEGYGRLVGPQRRADAAARGADLAPLRHPLGGRAVRRRRPARAGLHVAPTPASRRTSPRRSRSCGSTECTPAAALADLRARGVRALLSEGGPTLFHGFLAAGLVDELFLTLTPLLTGDEAETAIVSGAAARRPGAVRACVGVAQPGTNCSCATRPSASLGADGPAAGGLDRAHPRAARVGAGGRRERRRGGVLRYTGGAGQGQQRARSTRPAPGHVDGHAAITGDDDADHAGAGLHAGAGPYVTAPA